VGKIYKPDLRVQAAQAVKADSSKA
jgi:hypothetical protein